MTFEVQSWLVVFLPFQVTESDTVKMYTDKQDPELHILEILKAEAIHAGEWTVEAANQVGKETMSSKVSIKSEWP